MKRIRIPGTDFVCSRFVFGTASLFSAGSRQRRLSLLEAAVDHGFTHFDSAPYYGFGIAERDLSHVLRRHAHVTVTTKVGLYSRGGDDQSAAEVLVRKAAGRLLPVLSRPYVDFAVARARVALDGSLRRLGRPRIDIYMLHEPTLDLVNTDEWQRWLESEQRGGRVAHFGLALTCDRLAPFLAHGSALASLVQVLDSLDRREADLLPLHGRPLQITYGYVSAARARGDGRSVTEILAAALLRNPAGPLIVSTRRAERLAHYRRLLESAA
jgi:aryl-alcohol dehydrogenase-like predicted oxidoreductase